MFDGLPQPHASCTAKATIERSSRIRPSSTWGRPTPQALSGCDLSVQFGVLLVQLVVLKPAMPIPDRMFQVATLKVFACPVSISEGFGPAGCVGEPPHANTNSRKMEAEAT